MLYGAPIYHFTVFYIFDRTCLVYIPTMTMDIISFNSFFEAPYGLFGIKDYLGSLFIFKNFLCQINYEKLFRAEISAFT